MSVDRIEEARHTSCELYLLNDMVFVVKQRTLFSSRQANSRFLANILV